MPLRVRVGLTLSARLFRLFVLDDRVAAGVDPSLMAVCPSDEVTGLTFSTPHLENLGVSIGLANAMSFDHQTVSRLRLHRDLRCSPP